MPASELAGDRPIHDQPYPGGTAARGCGEVSRLGRPPREQLAVPVVRRALDFHRQVQALGGARIQQIANQFIGVQHPRQHIVGFARQRQIDDHHLATTLGGDGVGHGPLIGTVGGGQQCLGQYGCIGNMGRRSQQRSPWVARFIYNSPVSAQLAQQTDLLEKRPRSTRLQIIQSVEKNGFVYEFGTFQQTRQAGQRRITGLHPLQNSYGQVLGFHLYPLLPGLIFLLPQATHQYRCEDQPQQQAQDHRQCAASANGAVMQASALAAIHRRQRPFHTSSR